jgi:hypothetical protein
MFQPHNWEGDERVGSIEAALSMVRNLRAEKGALREALGEREGQISQLEGVCLELRAHHLFEIMFRTA